MKENLFKTIQSYEFSNHFLVAKRSNKWQKDTTPGKKIRDKKIRPPVLHSEAEGEILGASYEKQHRNYSSGRKLLPVSLEV